MLLQISILILLSVASWRKFLIPEERSFLKPSYAFFFIFLKFARYTVSIEIDSTRHIKYWNPHQYYQLSPTFTSWSDIHTRKAISPPVALQRSASGQHISKTRHPCRCHLPLFILALPLKINYPCGCYHWTCHPHYFPLLGNPCPWSLKGPFIPDQTTCCS